MQVLQFFGGQNWETFDVQHAFFRLSITNRRKVINSEKQSGLFWPTLYIKTDTQRQMDRHKPVVTHPSTLAPVCGVWVKKIKILGYISSYSRAYLSVLTLLAKGQEGHLVSRN